MHLKITFFSHYFFFESLHPAPHGKSNGVTCRCPCALCLGHPRSPNHQPSRVKKARSLCLAICLRRKTQSTAHQIATQPVQRGPRSQSVGYPALPVSLPPSLLAYPLDCRPLNRPPGWTTRRDADARARMVGRPTTILIFLVRPSERLSVARSVGSSVLPPRPSASSALRGE